MLPPKRASARDAPTPGKSTNAATQRIRRVDRSDRRPVAAARTGEDRNAQGQRHPRKHRGRKHDRGAAQETAVEKRGKPGALVGGNQQARNPEHAPRDPGPAEELHGCERAKRIGDPPLEKRDSERPRDQAEQEEREHQAERVRVRAEGKRQKARPDHLKPERRGAAERRADQGGFRGGRAGRSQGDGLEGGLLGTAGEDHRTRSSHRCQAGAEPAGPRDAERFEERESGQRRAGGGTERVHAIKNGHRPQELPADGAGVPHERGQRATHEHGRRKE
jgi:hypothetical protein